MDPRSLIAPSDIGCIHQSQRKIEDLNTIRVVVSVNNVESDEYQTIHHPTFDEEELSDEPSSSDQNTQPITAWNELKTIAKLAIPVSITSIARVVMWNTDQIFLGHLGTKQLAGASLADNVSEMITFLVYSPAWSLNGLCSQALGSGNRKMAGYWLQLTVILCTLICVPVSIGYFFISNLIALMSHDAEVVGYSQLFAHFAVLFLWTNAMNATMRLFHQSLEIVTPFTVISTIAIVLNIAANQLWIHGLHAHVFGYNVDIKGLGFIGSPLATSTSFLLQMVMCYIWCFAVKRYFIVHETWSGWSLRETVFHGKRVRELMKIVVPITISNCSENWAYQVIVLYAAKLDAAEIAALSCTFAVWGILWSFYSGFGVSIVTRVGKRIGGGQIAEAQLTAKMGLVLSLTACLSTASVVFALSDKVAMVYSADPEVISVMRQCIRILCITYVIGGVGWTAMSILEAMSKNKAKGLINVLCAWFGYVPACVFLMTGDNHQYIGMAPVSSIFVVGLAVEFVRATLLWIVVLRTDWNKASRDAKERNERYDEMAKGKEQEEMDSSEEEEEYLKLEEDAGGGHERGDKMTMSFGGVADLIGTALSNEAAKSA